MIVCTNSVHCQMLFDIAVGTKSLEYREGNDIRWMSVCDFMCNSIYVCGSRFNSSANHTSL